MQSHLRLQAEGHWLVIYLILLLLCVIWMLNENPLIQSATSDSLSLDHINQCSGDQNAKQVHGSHDNTKQRNRTAVLMV